MPALNAVEPRKQDIENIDKQIDELDIRVADENRDFTDEEQELRKSLYSKRELAVSAVKRDVGKKKERAETDKLFNDLISNEFPNVPSKGSIPAQARNPNLNEYQIRTPAGPRVYNELNRDNNFYVDLAAVAGKPMKGVNKRDAEERIERHSQEEWEYPSHGMETRATSTANIPGLVVPRYLLDWFGTRYTGMPAARQFNIMPLTNETVHLTYETQGTNVEKQTAQGAAFASQDTTGGTFKITAETFGGLTSATIQALNFGSLPESHLTSLLAKKKDEVIENLVFNNDTATHEQDGLTKIPAVTDNITAKNIRMANSIVMPDSDKLKAHKIVNAIIDAQTAITVVATSMPNICFMSWQTWGLLRKYGDNQSDLPIVTLSQFLSQGRDIYNVDSSGQLTGMAESWSGIAGFVAGIPVACSYAIPVNVALSTPAVDNSTYYIVADRSELMLFLSAPMIEVDNSIGFKEGVVWFRIYCYAAHTMFQKPAAVSRVSGHGTVIA